MQQGDESDEQERPAKIPRIEPPSHEACFDDVNGDCLHLIMTHLHFDDLNSVAQCSRHCRDARSNPELDQTRSGTIICREGSTVMSIFRAARAGHWGERVFVGNRTHLRVEGITRLTKDRPWVTIDKLPGVTSADFSLHADAVPDDAYVTHGDRASYLCRMLPNLRELDLSYVTCSPHTMHEFWTACPLLSIFKWKGGKRWPTNRVVADDVMFRALTELNVDDSVFHVTAEMREVYGSESEPFYLWMRCPTVECISMKGMTMRTRITLSVGIRVGEPKPVAQEAIIKFVRRHRPLRWLRSDLTAENVAMLQLERPEVTFVSE